MASSKSVPYCVGKWLPSDQAKADSWLSEMVNGMKQANSSKEMQATNKDTDFKTDNLLPPIKRVAATDRN